MAQSIVSPAPRPAAVLVVLRTREHLAVVKPTGNAIVIELMHFDNELVKANQFELPPAGVMNKIAAELPLSSGRSITEQVELQFLFCAVTVCVNCCWE